MQRRKLLAAAATTALAATAGCTGMLNTSAKKSCPDSPTPVEDIDTSSNDRVIIIGTVTTINKDEEIIELSADTGDVVISLPPWYPSEGDCVRVDAIPQGCIGDGCREGTYVQALEIVEAERE